MTQSIEKFEDLYAWQEARVMTKEIYHLTRQDDLCRDFGVSNQIQRASVSVMSNLAEGFERSGLQEKLNFYNIARASCAEVRSLLYVIEDNFPDQAEETPELRELAIRTGKMVHGLHTSTRKRLAFTTLPILLAVLVIGMTLFKIQL